MKLFKISVCAQNEITLHFLNLYSVWDFYIYSEMLNTYALGPGNANLNLNLGSLFCSILQTLVAMPTSFVGNYL